MKRAVAVVVALSFVGCPLLKSKKDDDGSNGTVTTVSGTGAKNEKDVLRYKEEIPMGDLPTTIGKDNVQAKAYPQLGQPVATLAKGYPVTQKAKYFSTGVLVLFADPATPGTQLLGWVAPEELATGAPVATTTTTNTAPKPTGTIAVTPVTKDAGAVAVVDAGTAPNANVAGALFMQLQPDGKCPTGFVANGGGCRRPCVTDANCPQKTFCKAKFCSSTK